MKKEVPHFDTMEAFWPYYLMEHRDPTNRLLHFIGTTIVVVLPFAALLTGRWWLVPMMPVAGYGFAWAGHFLIEKNRPATFTYPRWSLICDFRMWSLMLTGRLGPHLERAAAGG
jgi:hypothetical protein